MFNEFFLDFIISKNINIILIIVIIATIIKYMYYIIIYFSFTLKKNVSIQKMKKQDEQNLVKEIPLNV